MLTHLALAQTLRDLDVETLFGVIGEGNLPLVDDFQRLDGRTYVAAAHEAGAVLMAHGYAQISGRVAAATVTHGPGLTNTITALVEGVRTRTPLVLIAGEVAADDPSNAQAIEQRVLLDGTGAGTVQVPTASSAVTGLREAFARATDERRPIVYLVPVDVLWEEAPDASAVDGAAPDAAAAHGKVSAADLDLALGAFAAARRPLIIAGHGAATAPGREALVALARARGARLATTVRAKDLFRGVPGDVGICGSFATVSGAEAISQADCVLAFGAGLNDYTTMSGDLLRGKRVVQVDIDPAALSRHYRADVEIIGDTAQVAVAMLDLLLESEIPPAANGADSGRADGSNAPMGDGQDPYRAARVIEAAMPANRTLAMDTGRFLHLAYRTFSNPPVGGYVHGLGFGVIGIGLAQAIGAWFARPGRPVLHVTGDGGFMLGGLTELHTAVRNGVDLVVVVLNDGSYGAEHIQLRRRGEAVDVSMMAWPDFAAVGRAFGLPSFTVDTVEDADGIAGFLEAREGPALIDVRIDPLHLDAVVP